MLCSSEFAFEFGEGGIGSIPNAGDLRIDGPLGF